MKIEWILSENGKQSYFAKTGKIATTKMSGEVDPGNWTEAKRKALAPYVKRDGIDLTDANLTAWESQSYQLNFQKMHFRADNFDPELAVNEFIDLLLSEDERKVAQEEQKIQAGEYFTWEPLTEAGRKHIEALKEREEESKRKDEEAKKKWQEAEAAKKAKEEERAQEREKEKAELAEWVDKNADELLKRRKDQGYAWIGEAIVARLESLTGREWLGDDGDAKKVDAPDMPALDAEKELSSANVAPLRITIHGVFDYLDGEAIEVTAGYAGYSIRLATMA